MTWLSSILGLEKNTDTQEKPKKQLNPNILSFHDKCEQIFGDSLDRVINILNVDFLVDDLVHFKRIDTENEKSIGIYDIHGGYEKFTSFTKFRDYIQPRPIFNVEVESIGEKLLEKLLPIVFDNNMTKIKQARNEICDAYKEERLSEAYEKITPKELSVILSTDVVAEYGE